jgi:hypothetical protein
VIEAAAQLCGGAGDMPEPDFQIGREIQPAQIDIAGTVPEPAAHLHEAVIHPGCAKKIADGKTFKRQSSRELVAADRDEA